VKFGRPAAAVGLVVHAVAHLAVYPVSGGIDDDVDSRFWIPLSLARDAAGWASRVLLVVAAVAFLATGHQLVGARTPDRWFVPATVGAVSSIAAVALLWTRLRPRPEALWIGAVISGVVLAAVVADLVVRRRRARTLTP